MAYETILVEIMLVGGSIRERQAAVHGVANAVNTPTLHKIHDFVA